MEIDAQANLTITSPIENLANVTPAQPGWTKTGTGTLTLSGTNTYTEPFTIGQNGGVVIASGSGALGAASATVTVNPNAQLEVEPAKGSGGATFANPLLISGSGVVGNGVLLNEAGQNSWTGQITLETSVVIGAAPGTELLIAGPGGGVPAITDDGNGYAITINPQVSTSGQIVFASADSYRGTGGVGTTIDNGVLTIQDPNALGTSSVLVNTSLEGTGTLQLDNESPARRGSW